MNKTLIPDVINANTAIKRVLIRLGVRSNFVIKAALDLLPLVVSYLFD